MTSEPGPRLLRYRLLESIVPLAASGEELVAYAHSNGSTIDDVVLDFMDWTYDFIPRLTAEGLLPGDLPGQLQELFDQGIAAMSAAPTEACEAALLRPEWAALRTTAQSIVGRFRGLGVPVPDVDGGLLGDISTVPAAERE